MFNLRHKTEPQPQPRDVCFQLFCGDEVICEGRFTVTANSEVSCFGSYRECEAARGSRTPALYEGILLEHQLKENGMASVGLKYYSVQKDTKSALGYKQKLKIDAALCMGAKSGLENFEAVTLGEEFEFVFRAHEYA